MQRSSLANTMLRIVLLIMFAAGAAVGQSEKPSLIPELITPIDFEVVDNGCADGSDMMEWRFEWKAVPGATAYHLYVQRTGATLPTINYQGIRDTSYTRKGKGYVAPQNADNWKWKVRAYVHREWQPWSEAGDFAVEPIGTDCEN